MAKDLLDEMFNKDLSVKRDLTKAYSNYKDFETLVKNNKLATAGVVIATGLEGVGIVAGSGGLMYYTISKLEDKKNKK